MWDYLSFRRFVARLRTDDDESKYGACKFLARGVTSPIRRSRTRRRNLVISTPPPYVYIRRASPGSVFGVSSPGPKQASEAAPTYPSGRWGVRGRAPVWVRSLAGLWAGARVRRSGAPVLVSLSAHLGGRGRREGAGPHGLRLSAAALYQRYFYPVSLISRGTCRVCEGAQAVALKAQGVQTALGIAGGLAEVPKGCSGGDFANPAAHRAIGGRRVPTPAPPSLRKVTAPSYHGPDTLPCALLARCARSPGVPRPESQGTPCQCHLPQDLPCPSRVLSRKCSCSGIYHSCFCRIGSSW